MQFTKNNVTAYKDAKLPAGPVISAETNWAESFLSITPPQAEILLAAVQTLYPHAGLSPIVYRRVIWHFDQLAMTMPKAAAMFADFCEKLAEAWPVAFSELAETYRIQVLKSIEATPEFIFTQRMSVRYLYDDIEVWAEFGYEGASVHLGGYISRGFNDLDWLPPLPNDL